MGKAIKTLKQQILEDLDRGLIYTDPKAQVQAVVEEVLFIDPTKINDPGNEEQNRLLDLFLQQQKALALYEQSHRKKKGKNNKSHQTFDIDETYFVNVPDPADPSKVTVRKIQLSHQVVHRLKKLSNGKLVDKYSVVSIEKKGSGNFGTVRKLVGTITRRRRRLSFNPRKPRVLKKELRIVQDLNLTGEALAQEVEAKRKAAEREADLLKATPHSHGKEPTIEPVYDDERGLIGYISQIVTEEFTGVELFEYLNKTYKALTIDQRFQITINLIRALKEQIHDVDIVHADIKSENIIIDPATLNVRIVDLGLSRFKEKNVMGGTPLYMPPEMYDLITNKNTVLNAKSDIFSLGLVIAEVWNVDIEHEYKKFDKSPGIVKTYGILRQRAQFQKEPLPMLFSNMTISKNDKPYVPQLKNEIHTFINKMLAKEQNQRPDEVTLLEEINQHYLNYRIRDASATLQATLTKVNETGFQLYQQLNYLMLNPPANKDITAIQVLIEAAIKTLPTDASPEVIAEFVKAADIKAFEGAKSVKDLMEITKHIVEKNTEHLEKLTDLAERITELESYFPLLGVSSEMKELREDVDELSEEIREVIHKKNKRQFKLDALVTLNQSFAEHIPDLVKALQTLETNQSKALEVVTIDPTKVNKPGFEYQNKILDLFLQQRKQLNDAKYPLKFKKKRKLDASQLRLRDEIKKKLKTKLDENLSMVSDGETKEALIKAYREELASETNKIINASRVRFYAGDEYPVEVPHPKYPDRTITLKIKLTHEMIHREKKLRSGKVVDRYSIIANGPIKGEGSFGKVRKVVGTIKRRQRKLLFSNRKKRILKAQTHSVNEPRITDEKLERRRQSALFEAEQLKKTPHSHGKEATIEEKYEKHGKYYRKAYESYIVSEEFPGIELFYFLHYHLQKLTVDQRLQLTINLIRSLKEQIHDVKIAHLDIKPENFIIDPATLEVRIIDLGLSANKERDHFVGSPLYTAPEGTAIEMKLGKKLNKQSDIFSLGLVLAEVWNASLTDDVKKFTYDPGFFGFGESYPDRIEGLFKGIEDAPHFAAIKDQVQAVIKSMTNVKQKSRPDELALLEKLNNVYLHYQLETDSAQSPEDSEKLIQASSVGFKLYKRLNALMLGVRDRNVSIIKNVIRQAIKELPRPISPAIIAEFARTANINVFANATSTQELMEIIDDITQTFIAKKQLLESMFQRAKELQTLLSYLTETPQIKELKEDMDELVDDIDEVLYKEDKRQFKLDNLAELNERFAAHLPDLEEQLTALETANKDQFALAEELYSQKKLDKIRGKTPAINPRRLSKEDGLILKTFLQKQNAQNNHMIKAGFYSVTVNINGAKVKKRFYLTNTLIYRDKVSYYDQNQQPVLVPRYSVVANKSPVSGQSSEVFDLVGTLKFTEHGIVFSDKHQRIAKNSNLQDAIHEADVLSRTPHARVKNLTADSEKSATIIMNKFGDMDLQAFIDRKLYKLSLAQQYLLVVNLLRALKEQAHDRGLYHTNINTKNIRIDSKTLAVDIIGFGNAVKTTEFTQHRYQDEKFSDIHQMGEVISGIFGGHDHNAEDVEYVKYVLGNKQTSLETCIQHFDIKYIEKTINQKYKPKQYLQKTAYHTAHGLGVELYDKLYKFNQTHQSVNRMEIYLKATINDLKTVKGLNDEAIKAFIDAAQIKAFEGLKPNQMLEKVDQIVVAVTDQRTRFEQLKTNANRLAKDYEKLLALFSNAPGQRGEYAAQALMMLKNLTAGVYELSNKQLTRQHTLDDWQALANIYADKLPALTKLETSLNQWLQSHYHHVLNQYKEIYDELNLVNRDDETIDIKNAVKNVIRQYLIENLTANNVKKDTGGAANNRRKDILAILKIVNNDSDSRLILNELKDRLDKVNSNGFFGSTFKKKVMRVVDHYQEKYKKNNSINNISQRS